ncbi:hypothetical protein LSH36_557g01029 [Paralvinella palmiformis]|uniref:Centrosomal protein CCDC61 n=1 Tax=Paralvinella palmiformis TaxID=53620 RepID=A0AAD9MVV7_9ANNE|nr:hypothetical protein LSH36_557g01029 [Paralvinella palmiformis]
MAEISPVSGSYVFRGVECTVTMTTTNDDHLTLEVEDQVTTDQWRASFDAPFIEDLTRKTGNYKQFPIFVNMMESAILKNSESVSLDLLTYSDLEKLRSRKTNAVSSKHIPSAARNPTLNSKRYLILTYTVEFDRIHYPLPLPYVGKPDPKLLQETIKQLRAEIKALKKHGTKDFRIKELEKLQVEYDRLVQEKEELESEFLNFRREVKHTKVGSAAKEIRILKDIVKNLEEDLLKERTKYTKAATRRSQEHRRLINELEEVKASERNLRARVKSLTNEMAAYKRREYSSSRERSLSRERSSSRDRTRPNTSGTSRPSSRTRQTSPVSSTGTRLPRFDPSAYIKEKQKRLSETKRRRRSRSGSLERITRIPSNISDQSLVGSLRSRTSSIESLSDVGIASDASDGRQSLSSTPESIRTRSKTFRDKENIIHTDVDGDSDYFDRSAEIGEIDARLNRLQQFMKNNL